mgnify:CR=1 FL=1
MLAPGVGLVAAFLRREGGAQNPLAANIALVLNNARLGAAIAVAMARG